MPSVLITGRGRGIGRATALELVRRGHRVIATARDPGQVADLPVDVRLQLDVTDAHSVERAIRAAGPIDVLISNAGAMFMAPVEATPPFRHVKDAHDPTFDCRQYKFGGALLGSTFGFEQGRPSHGTAH